MFLRKRMRYSSLSIWGLVIVFVFSMQQISAQNTSARMYISGGVVNFAFNSLQKYRTGISYTDYTVFNIVVKDANNPDIFRWRLTASGNAPEFVGDNGLSTLNLATKEYLFLIATADAGPGIPNPATPTAGFFIKNFHQVLVEDGRPNCFGYVLPVECTPNANQWNSVSVSYHFGVTNKLIDENETPDYYFLDIQFTLETYN